MTAFAFKEHPAQVPPWFLEIINKYVPGPLRTQAIHDYAVAHADRRQPLTPRQRQLYDFLAEFIAQHGYAPTCEQIKEHLHVLSTATVFEHLSNLERKNWITRRYNETRGITLLEVTE